MVLQFTPTKDDYVRSLIAFQLNNRRMWYIILIAGIFEIAFLILALARGDFQGPYLSYLVVLFLFIPLMVLYVLFGAPILVGQKAQKDARLRTRVVYEFYDEQLTVRDCDHNMTMGWENFQSIFENKEYFLLIYAFDRNMFQILPKRAIPKGQEAALRKFFHQKIDLD